MNDPLNLTQTRVLLAHRNNAAAKLFESMLRGFGIHNIHTARSAKDLAENFSAGHIDMAIIDNSVGRKEISASCRMSAGAARRPPGISRLS